MLACPNVNTKEWKDLVKTVGEREAFRAYMSKGDGSIPKPSEYVQYTRTEPSVEKGQIGINKKQLLMLLGPTMYNKPLAQVAVKELLQNSFDAVKTVQNLSKKEQPVAGVQEQKQALIRKFNQVQQTYSAENKKVKIDDQGNILSGDPYRVIKLLNILDGLKQQIENFKPTTQVVSTGAKPGNVIFDINYDERTISIKDDGIGMTPEIVKSAFLSIGGTNKEGLSEGERSGGFGLAKVQFLLGSDYVEVDTVRDGVKTSIRASNLELYNDDFQIRTEQTSEPNGTFVKVKIPESYITPEGTTRSIDFPGEYSSDPVERFDILNRPLIGNLKVRVNTIKRGATKTKVLPVGNNISKEVLPPLLSNVKFGWGGAEVYVGEEKTESPRHEVLSSGLFQFSERINFRDFEPIPYNIVINIKPSVGSTAEQYPFNNQREGFKNTVQEDIKSLYAYLRKYAAGEAEKDAVDVFKNIRALPKTDPNKILTPEEREKLYKEVEDTIAESKKLREKYKDTFERKKTRIVITGKVVENEESGEQVEVEREKQYGSSFEADKQIGRGYRKSNVDTSAFKENEPQYHNNTNFDYLAVPGAVEFFSDFGSVVYDMVRFAGKELDNRYEKLSGKDRKFFAGVSIDKSYGGVHIRKIIDAIFINPLTAPSKYTVEGLVGFAVGVTTHEINHTTVSSEGSQFTSALEELRGSIYETGKMGYFEGLFRSVFKKHYKTFKNLQNEFNKSSTRNLSKSFDGDEISRDYTWNIYGNATDVPAGQATQGRDQRDQEYSEGSGQQDKTGDVIISQLTNPPLSPEEIKAKVTDKILTTIANNLSLNLGVPYSIISSEEARSITEKTETPWNGEPAFFYGGQVYFVGDNMSLDKVFHEFSHPLVDAIYNTNPKLFNTVYNGLLATPEGELLSSQVAKAYPKLEADSALFKKEMFVRAITHEAMAAKKTKGFSEFIKKIMFMVKQALRSVFGNGVKVEKLSVNTSLAELANMLKSERFNLDPNVIIQNEVQYIRDISEYTEDLQKIDDSATSEIIRNYYRLVQNQINRIRKNKRYNDAKDLLIDDETKSGILQGIKLTLENTAEIDKRLESLLTELEVREKNVNSLVHAVLKLDMLTSKISDRIFELKKNVDDKKNLTNIIYYDYLIKSWSEFVNEMEIKLADAGLDLLNNEFGKTITGLRGRLDSIKRVINNSYGPGVVTILKESLAPLIQGIDNVYGKRIEQLEKNNGNPKLINDLKEEWEKTRLTDQRILDLLTNKAGDTNLFSYMAEAYTNSPDPIVGGFTMYVKNAYNRADAIVQQNINEFTNEIEPLLSAAGYSRSNFTSLMRRLVFKDNVSFYNEKTDAVETKEVYTFLNNFKNVDNILSKYSNDIEKAKKEDNKEEVDDIIKKQRKHLRDYFHQEYVKEYYEREAIYDSIDADPALKDMTYKLLGINMSKASADEKASVSEFYSDVAKETYREKYLLLNKIKQLEAYNYYDEASFEDSVEEVQGLWRDYTRMSSFTDNKGNPKINRDLLKAYIERKYRKANNKFNEWVPITGLGNKPSFEFALRAYEQSLVDSHIEEGSDEFNEKKQRWIDKNTTIAYTDEFYQKRNEVLEKLRAVYATIPKNIRDNIDSTSEMEEMLDMVTGFRDEDGQIIGSDMSITSKDKIRSLQQAVADKRNNMAGFSGLTKAEMEEIGTLYEKIISKQKLTPGEKYRLQELQDAQAVDGVDKATRAEINLLYKKLAELQSKEATDYYVNTVNEYLNDMGEPLVDNVTANDLGDPTSYVRLFNKSPEFAKWFKENHILKEVYDKESDQNIMVYDRLFVWNRTRPNDPDHYVKTTLSNGEVVQGKPILAYYYRSVKPEFRTERIVGETIDNKGNWLPLRMDQGAKDNLYQNEAYDRLRREDPAAFAVLEKMKEYHLKYQEGNPNNKKLYMQAPRYRSMAVENVVKSASKEGVKRILYNIRQVFFKSSDDYEDGFNFKENKLPYLEMLDSDVAEIPVTGLYNLKPEEVSMNLLDGMMRYMFSSVRQRELLDINPFAQAIKQAAMINISKRNDKITYSNRAKAIQNLYDREFKGESLNQSSVIDRAIINTRGGRAIAKIIDSVTKVVSLGFFALNMPSAIKNAYGQKIQGFIEASGGRFLGPISLAKGKRDSFQVMSVDAMKGIEYYRTGNRSLRMQMLQIFDPQQEYMKKQVGQSFGRSFVSDLANGSWLLSPRKFLSYEATIQSFFGILHHVKVPQIINGQTKEIEYFDAWKMKDGQIQLKEGIDKEWAPGGNKFNEVKNISHELTNRLEGTYAGFDQPEINRYYILRKMLFMKKFFMSMAANHVAVSRPSAALGTISAGNYTNLLRVFKNATKYGPSYIYSPVGNKTQMSAEEVSAFKKVLTQVATISAMYATLYLVFGFDGEDKYKKMKRRSAALGSNNFNLEGWLINNGEVTLYLTMTEIDTWWHPIIAVKQVADIPFQSSLWDKGVKTPIKILYNIFGALTGNDDAFYEKNVGPYPWQKRGGSKAINDAAKILGFTGSTLDPQTTMRDIENLQRKISFK